MRRRTLLATAALTPLPRFAIAQADTRPTVTVAVQKISNSNTFETTREQSNVGYRLSASFADWPPPGGASTTAPWSSTCAPACASTTAPP